MEKATTPAEVHQALEDGNLGYVDRVKKGKAALAAYPLEEADPGQNPKVAVLSCADSRVIPEVIFGAKVGELFVVRIAGNIASTDAIASLEYAVKYLGVKEIIVLGHEFCGAVSSTIKFATQRLNFGYNLNNLLAQIIPAISDPTTDDLEAAVKRNARLSACALLQRSTIIKEYYSNKLIGLAWGYYQINSGRVQIQNAHCEEGRG
jgi:carbonic anhydrase